ncbi:heterokaryon incompatibility domain-containing protein [Trichoderma austrokoningii]
MRLLSTKTLEFCEFLGTDIPRYAILSHRWERDEMSYQDMMKEMERNNSWPSPTESSPRQGYRKISEFRRLALQDGYEYIWVDTCCIDKTSSAELQEAINSMYQWYWASDVCYAYLSDVSVPLNRTDADGRLLFKPSDLESFQKSQWFTRGWTLQELLAPRALIFVDQNWKKFGTAYDLEKFIEKATSIQVRRHVHQDCKRSEALQVGQCMAWAATRSTTRIEDRAYSLLGLFDVNLPMMYGEGGRAFQRLQEEILGSYEDASVLAWSQTDADTGFAPNGLAPSPDHFRQYPRLIDRMSNSNFEFATINPTLTRRGVQVTLSVHIDQHDLALGYAFLLNSDRPFSNMLVLPLLLTKATSKLGEDLEAVRFSDPLWVAQRFVGGGDKRLVCLLRQAQTADMKRRRDGFSLSSRVWANYTPTLAYPTQAKTESRHFPAVFGGVTGDMEGFPLLKKEHVLAIELMARSQTSERFVVLVDYNIDYFGTANINAVKAFTTGREMDLADLADLTRSRGKRYPPCDLLDQNGTAIPADEIIQIQKFSSYWVQDEDEELTKPPVEMLKQLCIIEEP